MPDAPLPIRDGLGPSRVRMPDAGSGTVLAHLTSRFPADAARIREKVDAGEVVDAAGRPITAYTPLTPRADIYLYRDPPVEVPVPWDVPVLHRDDALVVVDKPPFLATMPRGGHITETALVRLRRSLDLPDLVPTHRLDRGTAGVLVFTVRRDVRRAYQELFRERAVTKVYEAVAPLPPDDALAVTVRSRIVKQPGVLQAFEEPGEPNSESRIEFVRPLGERGLYRLAPRTGKTHQLRVHMNALGLPIDGDPLYPSVKDVAPDDFSTPLQLLSRSIAFDDPFTGERRRFASRRVLPARGHSGGT